MGTLDRAEAKLKYDMGYWESESGRRMYQRHRRIMRRAVKEGRMPKAYKAIPKEKRKG